jgi:hypothetical protein
MSLLRNTLLVVFGITSVASANYSGNRCSTTSSGSVASLCSGRVIPASKARNFHRGSQKMLCSSNVDHYIRRPQKFDFTKWSTHVQNNQADQAFQYRRSLPAIQWKGAVPFTTVEAWTWESCDYVTSSFHCGTTTKTRTYDCSYTTPRSCDAKNRCTGGNRVSKTCTETYQDPNSCHADISQSEQWACSNEIMTYNAEYVRPDEKSWNPKTPGFKDAIPNKYDLLPGEVEDVQVSNNASFETSVSPQITVGDAWNKYQFSKSINGTTAVACVENGKYHAEIKVITQERIPSKKTPNAFRLPHDAHGKKINAIEGEPVALEPSGSFTVEKVNEQNYIAGKPSALMLDDTSSSMMSLIAEQSRKNAPREQAKEQLGLGTNKDGSDDKKDPGFFKFTKVKVEMISNNRYWWNTTSTERIIVDDIDAVQMDFRAFSNNQDIAYSDLWKIVLNDPQKKGNNIYMVGESSERTLRPNQDYILKVSMYQKGAKDFYKQDCEEDKNAWDCKWWALFFKRSEKDYYSDSLDVHFKTPEKMKDQRGFGRKMADFFDIF